MNISKEKFTELAKEHLLALESYKMDKNGNKPIEIFGIEKLYEAINCTHCCKSDSELLFDFLEWFDNYCTVDIKPNKEDVELYLSK